METRRSEVHQKGGGVGENACYWGQKEDGVGSKGVTAGAITADGGQGLRSQTGGLRE